STNLKHSEPAEARKPPSTHPWRLYVFKEDNILEVIHLWERSVWLLGRDQNLVDIITPHPSCSGQHAALQFRNTLWDHDETPRAMMEHSGTMCVGLFLVDLDSTHHTSLNGTHIESNRYVKVKNKDVIRFGGSKRDYVVLLPDIS
ncbi:SMAD/FHA domain-containing protein, partial [Ampelomyces quisqualis]